MSTDDLFLDDFMFRVRYGDHLRLIRIPEWPISHAGLNISTRAPSHPSTYHEIGIHLNCGSPSTPTTAGDLSHALSVNLFSPKFSRMTSHLGVAGNQHGAICTGISGDTMYLPWNFFQDDRYYEIVDQSTHPGDFGSVYKLKIRPKSIHNDLSQDDVVLLESLRHANETLINNKRKCTAGIHSCRANHIIVAQTEIIGMRRLALPLVGYMSNALGEVATLFKYERLPEGYCSNCTILTRQTQSNIRFEEIPVRCLRKHAMPCVAKSLKLAQIANHCVHQKTESAISHLTTEHKGAMELLDVEIVRILDMMILNATFLKLGQDVKAVTDRAQHYSDYLDGELSPKLENPSLWDKGSGLFVTSPDHAREIVRVISDLLCDLENCSLNPNDTAEWRSRLADCSPNFRFIGDMLSNIVGNPVEEPSDRLSRNLTTIVQKEFRRMELKVNETVGASIDRLGEKIAPPMIVNENAIFNVSNGDLVQTLLALFRGGDSIEDIARKVVVNADDVERRASQTRIRQCLTTLVDLRLANWKKRTKGQTSPNPGVLTVKGRHVALEIERRLQHYPNTPVENGVVHEIANSMDSQMTLLT